MLHPLGQISTDGRLLANLVAVHLILLALVGVSFALRWLVSHCSNRLANWASGEKLKQFSAEATRHGHTMLFWLTVTAMALTAIGGVVYHLLGEDVRTDWQDWYSQLTMQHFVHFGVLMGSLAGLAVGTSVLVRVLRRVLPVLENYAIGRFGHPKNEATLHHWFHMLQGFVTLAVRLAAVCAACRLLGFGKWLTVKTEFTLEAVAVFALARLLTLACRATTHLIAERGTKHLSQSAFHRYWDRMIRLFPLGERCFDGAVYVGAASFIVYEFNVRVTRLAVIGENLVECIGIFFCTRVAIELLQVLLNEAFGMYREDGLVDQKGRTLVPLLHSVCQYVLYFCSTVMMMHILGVPTSPILAGAGILGLGVGLGAQSLVTDVVSGFFILFESQYLVGDYVSVGDSAGIVEEVSLRVTKIRDGKGKLHIIPNGQIKEVVSYSKEYVNAVVDVKMPSGGDLESLFRAMKDAGRRLRQVHSEVLADTEIHGLVEWSTSEMTIRAVTKVQPGTHGAMQSEYRRMLKQVFDEKQPLPRTAVAA